MHWRRNASLGVDRGALLICRSNWSLAGSCSTQVQTVKNLDHEMKQESGLQAQGGGEQLRQGMTEKHVAGMDHDHEHLAS
ncbi:hypothetical protein HPB47_017514 [Ixodes persulcatus]|uniref:Uncharacterized protein n=1 Tax=Ixodes persulcatus TaxID=34615 RepID=A0AC60QNZ8_IXOPE|nr:hypothetical protein HPB47_017514 [Ixodes persulcatus]